MDYSDGFGKLDTDGKAFGRRHPARLVDQTLSLFFVDGGFPSHDAIIEDLRKPAIVAKKEKKGNDTSGPFFSFFESSAA